MFEQTMCSGDLLFTRGGGVTMFGQTMCSGDLLFTKGGGGHDV